MPYCRNIVVPHLCHTPEKYPGAATAQIINKLKLAHGIPHCWRLVRFFYNQVPPTERSRSTPLIDKMYFSSSIILKFSIGWFNYTSKNRLPDSAFKQCIQILLITLYRPVPRTGHEKHPVHILSASRHTSFTFFKWLGLLKGQQNRLNCKYVNESITEDVYALFLLLGILLCPLLRLSLLRHIQYRKVTFLCHGLQCGKFCIQHHSFFCVF